MSEFLVMAATLLDIKCRMLLPKETNEEGEEEDPRDELVQKLLEYKMYKYMSYELKDRMDNAAGVFYKKETVPDEVMKYREPVDPEELLKGLTLEKLNEIYQSVLKRQEEKIDPVRSKFGTIEKEEVSLSDKMVQMKEYASSHRKFSFRRLLEGQKSRGAGDRNFSVYSGTDENGGIFMYSRNSFSTIYRLKLQKILRAGAI